MKRIIALIVLICCCCVYSAYSLVQPLSLTRTSGSGSGNATRSVPDCSTIQIDGKDITAVGIWNTNSSSANCHNYTTDSCVATNQGTYYFCSTDDSLDDCLNDDFGTLPAAYYDGNNSPIPCKFGSVDGKNIVAFDYQLCEFLFEDFYEQFYDDRFDLACYGQRNVCYLLSDYSPKYYCTSSNNYELCGSNEFRYSYGDGFTKPCLIGTGGGYYENYGAIPIVGYTKPETDCIEIFDNTNLINSLSTQSDVNCGPYSTASCLYNGVKKYYCQGDIYGLQDCPDGAKSYYSTATPVPCSLGSTTDGKYVVGFKKGDLCSTLFSGDLSLSRVPPDPYDDCPYGSFAHLCYTQVGVGIPTCIGDARLSVYNTDLQDCSDEDWVTRPTNTHTGACKTDILVEESEDYLVGFVEPPTTTINCNSFVNTISGSFNFLSDDESFCGGFDAVACKASSGKKYLCYDNNVNVSDLPECAGNVYTGSMNADYSYYSHSYYRTPCKTSNKYYDHWTLVGFMSNLCTYIVPGSSDDFFIKDDVTYRECGNNSYLKHNYCSKQNDVGSGFCYLSGNKELPQCPANPAPVSLFRDDLATFDMKNFPCDMNLTYNNKKVIAFAQLYSCDYRKTLFLGQKDVYTETLTQGEDPANLTKHACYIEGNDDFTYIYHVCTDMKKAEDCGIDTVLDQDNLCPYNRDYGKCKCSDEYMTVDEYKQKMGITNSETVVKGNGYPCTADGEDKYNEFNVVPLCEDIIENQNSLGEPGKEKDGWYVRCSNPNETACSTSDGRGSFVCRHCGAENNVENGYNFEKSFKIDSETSPCLQGCHEDYACSYTKTDDTTITYCSQCNCSGYASKLELCSVGFEGEENNIEILASPCNRFGKVDENERCELSPIDDTLPIMYKKVLCPDGYVTLEAWLETSQNIIEDNKFLENNLNISNENQWINYFVPQTDEDSKCDYAVEVVKSGSGGTDVDSDNEDTNDPENRSYSGSSDNLDGYEIQQLETKYKGFNLNCQALVETLPNLEFISQAYLHNYNDHTTCWDIESNQEKYLATCHEDYLLPEEGYEVIGNEDVCKFNGKDYYKYGGSCPVIFSGKEAVVPENISDDAIRSSYGSVKISYCNDKGVKKKVTLCDPNIYNQICEYPYEYADGQPQKEWCFRNIRGKAVNPSDIANNVKYYTNTGLPIQCEYDPDSCDSILQNDSNTNDVFIENSPNDCIKKYGTAVQTKLCNGEYNIPKYACYYPKNTYKFTTQNCPIGRDLSRPYILINGVKHWDRCDCPPAYKYHVNNCRVYDLGGDTCEQKIDSHFIDTANDPTLPTSGSIKLYTKCNDPQITQPNGCKTPLGTWAKCYYCCPKGTRATGNLSIDGCGAKIYECK